ncbi:phosphatase domain-containing protein [Rhodovibrionaceae bacterium A322]
MVSPVGSSYLIASVAPLKPGWGHLGIAACPGLRPSQSSDKPADHLREDLQAIKQWGADVVLTFMESEELDKLGVGKLPQEVRDLGMVWLHLPIADFGAPPPDTQERWWQVLPDLRRRLADGQSLFFHCRGGQGRSGMMLAKLLVAEGLAPVEAMSLVRSVRRGAIETAGQENWVEAGADEG